LKVQVTAYGRQTVPDRGVVMSCDPLQNFWGFNRITGTAEPKVVKFCTRVGYINSSNRMTYHQQKVWLWSRDCFKLLPFVVMQRVARVCQRQLSYLFNNVSPLENSQLQLEKLSEHEIMFIFVHCWEAVCRGFPRNLQNDLVYATVAIKKNSSGTLSPIGTRPTYSKSVRSLLPYRNSAMPLFF